MHAASAAPPPCRSDWKRCAEHVGTRDHRAFTSHAQVRPAAGGACAGSPPRPALQISCPVLAALWRACCPSLPAPCCNGACAMFPQPHPLPSPATHPWPSLLPRSLLAPTQAEALHQAAAQGRGAAGQGGGERARLHAVGCAGRGGGGAGWGGGGGGGALVAVRLVAGTAATAQYGRTSAVPGSTVHGPCPPILFHASLPPPARQAAGPQLGGCPRLRPEARPLPT